MNEELLHVGGFLGDTLSNGPGIRNCIFVCGCHLDCKNCHNKDLQSFDKSIGKMMTIEEIKECVNEYPLARNITFSGGEPTLQARVLSKLAIELKKENRHIMMYTGFTIEELKSRIDNGEVYLDTLLQNIDILVDGPYLEELQDLTLKYRGSSNQRLIYKEEIEKILKGEIQYV